MSESEIINTRCDICLNPTFMCKCDTSWTYFDQIINCSCKGENKNVVICDQGSEKYGRARASIELPSGQDLAEYLIENKIGIEYHGEKKKSFAALTMI